VGIPEGIGLSNSKGFGLLLVSTLVEQLGGSILLDRSAGSTFELEFDAAGSSS
jgi:two-component sensor histidine kinase